MSAHRSIVTVYTLTIQFRIDERPSHHDSGNEGLMTLKDIKRIALVEKIVCVLCCCFVDHRLHAYLKPPF